VSDKLLTVKLQGSVIGQNKRVRSTVLGLGLKKVGSQKELKDTPQVRGMIAKVNHLVELV
jgi:large subunit ribosomal protein L30